MTNTRRALGAIGAAVALTALPAVALAQTATTAGSTTTTTTPPNKTSPTTGATGTTGTAASASTSAAAPNGVMQGATVYDTSGGVVGTINSLDNGFAVVATTQHKVRLPVSSFGKGDKGPVLAMTAAQLDAAAAAATPAQPATPPGPPQLAAGETVNDTSGGVVGTIDSVGDDFAVVATSKNKVRLPLTSFAKGPNGPMIGMTAAQLDQAAAAAAPGANPGG